MVFIVLKSYIGFGEDSREAYPSMEMIYQKVKMGEKRARKSNNALIKKGIVKKVQRGLTKTNLYTLDDYSQMWDCGNAEEKTPLYYHVRRSIEHMEEIGVTSIEHRTNDEKGHQSNLTWISKTRYLTIWHTGTIRKNDKVHIVTKIST